MCCFKLQCENNVPTQSKMLPVLGGLCECFTECGFVPTQSKMLQFWVVYVSVLLCGLVYSRCTVIPV